MKLYRKQFRVIWAYLIWSTPNVWAMALNAEVLLLLFSNCHIREIHTTKLLLSQQFDNKRRKNSLHFTSFPGILMMLCLEFHSLDQFGIILVFVFSSASLLGFLESNSHWLQCFVVSALVGTFENNPKRFFFSWKVLSTKICACRFWRTWLQFSHQN